MQNVTQTIVGQYQNSPTITGIISRMNDAIDPANDLDALRAAALDIDTAFGFGLDRLGRIIGLSRDVKSDKTPAVVGNAIVGLTIVGYTGSGTGSIKMTDAEYRTALKLKAFSNVTRCSITTMNEQLRMLANGRGNAWVHDMNAMRITYYFAFALTNVERALIKSTDMLMKPSACATATIEAPKTLAVVGSAIVGLTIVGT